MLQFSSMRTDQPLGLTDCQLAALMALASVLPLERRGAFLQAVARLAASTSIDDAIVLAAGEVVLAGGPAHAPVSLVEGYRTA